MGKCNKCKKKFNNKDLIYPIGLNDEYKVYCINCLEELINEVKGKKD